MKKTVLTVLCLALGATIATAQTNAVKLPDATLSNTKTQYDAAVSPSNNVVKGSAAGYKGTIFSKAGELMTCTFATDGTGYSTGTISNGSTYINGDLVPQHTQQAYHSQWRRIQDTTSSTCSNLRTQGNYPVTFGSASTDGFKSLNGFDSETAMQGIMVMTMQDQIAGWGGTGATGAFNAFIAFPAINASSVAGIDVIFYQYYRCFNNDHCWIDYKVAGDTAFRAVEINVRGVDVTGGSSLLSNLTTTLPSTVAHNSSVELRIRWSCDNPAGGAYGYYWFLDDVKVVASPADRLKMVNPNYFEGFYQQMPAGMSLPVVWRSWVTNNGINTQNNIVAKVYAYNEDATTPVEIANSGAGKVLPFAPDSTMPLNIDPFGYHNWFRGWGYDVDDTCLAYASGTKGYLPTNLNNDVAGYFFTNVSTTNLTSANDGATLDTIGYHVNNNTIATAPNTRVWSHTNGIMRKFSHYLSGYTTEGYTSFEASNIGCFRQNYRMQISYTTGDVIPEGWVIRGMRIVPSTYQNEVEVGTRITPLLSYDSVYATSAGASVKFKYFETGVDEYQVATGDILSNDTLSTLTYRTLGNYKAMTIMFPNQVQLQPRTTYRVGYMLPEDGYFLPAASTNAYYKLQDSTAVWFDTVPGMKSYARVLGNGNPYSILMIDPNRPIPADGSSVTWMGNHRGNIRPMMDLIVGPAVFIPKHGLTFQCGEGGEFMNSSYETLCERTDSVYEGSTISIYIMPEDGYEIDEVFVDGNSIGTMKTGFGGKLTLSVELENAGEVCVKVEQV